MLLCELRPKHFYVVSHLYEFFNALDKRTIIFEKKRVCSYIFNVNDTNVYNKLIAGLIYIVISKSYCYVLRGYYNQYTH